MALTYEKLELALNVFNSLKTDLLPDLKIPSFPEDMSEWNRAKNANPPTNTLLGYSKTDDGGWQGLAVFLTNPSDELIKALKERFISLPSQINISEPYIHNPKLWCFGWA